MQRGVRRSGATPTRGTDRAGVPGTGADGKNGERAMRGDEERSGPMREKVMESSTTPISTGERVFFVGHSFHMFVVRPLIRLCKEAGIPGHWAEGWDMIGGSTPLQHWERGGDENAVKKALATGRVQTLTLATNVRTDDPAVDLFADLAVKHNPDVRVMLQHSWGDHLTGALMRARHDTGERRDAPRTPEALRELVASVGSNTDRDAMTAAQVAGLRARGIDVWRERLAGINRRHGRTLAYLVPVNEAVVRTREAVLRGGVPGVARQSDLFRDVLGHATEPTMDLVSYVWFGALYRKSPVGLEALIQRADPDAPARHRVLQEIAWAATLEEPFSGVAPA